MKTSFSIIVPVYNTPEAYLRQCILSLKNQTYTDIEIILVNDGSTHDCERICDEFANLDERIRVIHQENKGVSTARNRGIDVASKPWILFVDPDDWVDVNLCESINNYLECDTDVDILMFTYIEEMKSSQVPHLLGKDKKIKFNKDDHDLLQLSILNYNKSFSPLMVGTIWAKAFRREFLLDNNIMFNKNLPKAQDIIFSLYAIELASKIIYVDMALYHYRINDSSVCNKYNSRIFDYISRVLNESQDFINRFEKDDRFQEAQKHMAIYSFRANMRIDFFNIYNPNSYFEKRKSFKNVLNKHEFKNALSCINIKDYSLVSRIEILLLKYKVFLPLFLLHWTLEKRLERTSKYRVMENNLD